MMSHVRRFAFVALVAIGAVALEARPAFAQQQATSEPAAAAPSAPAGPTMQNAQAAARPLASADARNAAPTAYAQNMGRPVALMLVGFGALVAGAIIGDDVGTIFMVGGAIIGLVGLYEYLR